MNSCAAVLIKPAPTPLSNEAPLALVPVPPALQPTTRRRLNIGLIGPGRVGSVLLDQLRAAQLRLARDSGLDLHIGGVLASRRMWLDCDDVQLNARAGGAQTWRPHDLDVFTAHLRGSGERDALIIDCSASDALASHYASWLAAGIHVVTPNKLAGSGPLARWQELREACASGARFRAEATVGAGLPVLQTLRDLLDTGDTLRSISGMLSGTLAWLCNRHDGAAPFSERLREAHALGYTEPDPREDLSGIDVARKLVILAREAGWPLSLDDVAVESLVPAELADVPLETFMDQLHMLDAPLDERLREARAAGGVLRHVAQLDEHGRASVRLSIVDATHAFAHTQLTDNVVQFVTERYADNPLMVQGPGAGPAVTAAGVFADVLRIAESLPRRALDDGTNHPAG